MVVERNVDNLTKIRYTFYMTDHYHMILDGCAIMKRATKAHKFKTTAIYTRLDRRYNNLDKGDFEIPQDVIQEAIDGYKSKIVYKEEKEAKF